MVLGLYCGISEDPKGDVGSLSKGEGEERNELNDEPNATKLDMRTLQTGSTYEQVEHAKAESARRYAELEAEIEKAIAEIEELKASLLQKEAETCCDKEENKVLKTEIDKLSERESTLERVLRRLASQIADLKVTLSAKEKALNIATEEICTVKEMIQKVNLEAMALEEAARAAEQEALLEPWCLSEEADKSSRRGERLTEQLDTAQAAHHEVEVEVRRSKVLSDLLREAAEEEAMLSTGNSSKIVERTRSLDRAYNPVTGNMCTRCSKGIDVIHPRRKAEGCATKKIGVLCKKGQK